MAHSHEIASPHGDTPFIGQPIRLVSCDTPEKAQYAGSAPVSQPKLDVCTQRLQGGFYRALPQSTRAYLLRRLGPTAADHIEAGVTASGVFESTLATRLTRPNGSRRRIGVIPTGEVIDRYGRMLAYIVPWYSGSNSDPLPPIGDPARATFNLSMIANGWAAFFPIFRSLPNDQDMNMAIAAAENAWNSQLGIWHSYGPNALLAYEYRLCIKLGTAPTAVEGIRDAFQRVCVDLRTIHNVGRFEFGTVPPPYRLWVWGEDEAEATSLLGLS